MLNGQPFKSSEQDGHGTTLIPVSQKKIIIWLVISNLYCLVKNECVDV